MWNVSRTAFIKNGRKVPSSVCRPSQDADESVMTRRWSLGTGFNEELGVHGLLQGVM